MRQSPIIITGMHGSGCDVLGALLSRLSLLGTGDFVQSSFSQSESKTTGSLHEFLDLLAATYLDREAVSGDVYEKAANLLDHLQEFSNAGIPLVGWFDSRSALLLDFWHSLDHEIKVVAVFNEPWVSSHLLRQIYPEQFLANPEAALKLWLEYNMNILQFKKKHTDNCLIIHSSSLETCFKSLLEWMGVEVADASRYKDISIKIKRADNSGYAAWPYPALYEAVYGEAYLCWMQLLDLADVCSSTVVGKESLRLPGSSPGSHDVAVIIPTFNQGHLLVDCIASVEEAAAQANGAVIELLVVDDGTTDPASKNILARLSDIGYRILSIPNGGLSNARNVGISSTRAPLIIPLDDDNLLQSAYLTEGMELMHENSGIAVVYGDREDFGLRCQIYHPGTVFFDDLLFVNRVDACALIRRSAIESYGGYDTTLTALEDWDLWLRVLSFNAQMTYLPKICFSYCHRPGSMIQRLLGNSDLLKNLVTNIRARYQPIC